MQQQYGENRSFEKASYHIFETSLHTAQRSDRIDVIFDAYRDKSIRYDVQVTRTSR